ncbi:MAG: hypothetical protein PHW60_06245 [Kiritimatiellae bacterium]|nr:hypothetical protein [Kiritimatiellia bacterium]
MKSLKKALDLLEYIVNHNNSPVTPSEAAGKLGLDAATCVRIMKEFTKQGYLEHVSRRAGYVPGPAVFTFSDRNYWIYGQIIQAAVEPVQTLAHKVRSVVNISVLYNNYRYILYHYCAASGRNITLQTRYWHDFYPTATGRLLLSTVPEATVKEIHAIFGIKEHSGNPVDLTAFQKELKEITAAGYVFFRDPATRLWIIGALVRPEGFPPAAIGFGISGDNCEDALKATLEAAKQIEDNLKNPALH